MPSKKHCSSSISTKLFSVAYDCYRVTEPWESQRSWEILTQCFRQHWSNISVKLMQSGLDLTIRQTRTESSHLISVTQNLSVVETHSQCLLLLFLASLTESEDCLWWDYGEFQRKIAHSAEQLQFQVTDQNNQFMLPTLPVSRSLSSEVVS